MSIYSQRLDRKRPYIIAELNTSHNGDLILAKKMALEAKKAGADCIKLQSFSSNTLYSDKYFENDRISKRFFDKVSLSNSELVEISNYCKEINVDFSSTTYSSDELKFLVEKCNPAFIKVASMEINNHYFLKEISQYKLPIVLSTGMSTIEEIQTAVYTLESNKDIDLTILHCTSNYPTDLSDVNLNNIITLKEKFPQHQVGFSDHTLGIIAPIVASVIGISVIEKHFTLDSSVIGMDNQMASEPRVFAEMKSALDKINIALGEHDRVLSEGEIKMKMKMRRSLVLSKDITAGTTITIDYLDFKRPGSYIPVSEIDNVIGKKVSLNLQRGDYLEYNHLDGGNINE